MGAHYFVTSSLPALRIGEPPDLSFQDLMALLQENLNRVEMEQCEVIRRYYDIVNFRAYWKEEPFDPYGIIPESQMEERLLTHEGLPEYVIEFLVQYEDKESRLRHHPQLVATFFRKEAASASRFLYDYLEFERAWRLVMVGFRAKITDRDPAVELQYEESDDRIVAQIIAQKDAKNYEPPYGFDELKGVFESHRNHPLALHKAMVEYRFNQVAQMTENEIFSLDYIQRYLVQLILVEKWEGLNEQQGLKMIAQISS